MKQKTYNHKLTTDPINNHKNSTCFDLTESIYIEREASDLPYYPSRRRPKL